MVPVQVRSAQATPEGPSSSQQGYTRPGISPLGATPVASSFRPARQSRRAARYFSRSSVSLLTLCALLSLNLLLGCSGKKKPVAGEVPHENYGGCQVQGRHYHNTHVYIGDRYEPSLTEWLKY